MIFGFLCTIAESTMSAEEKQALRKARKEQKKLDKGKPKIAPQSQGKTYEFLC